MELVARAPAKVNLVLRVGPRRPDGYHDLATLLVPLDLGDEVRVKVEPGRRGPVRCRAPGRPDLDGPGNLAARAAEAFRLRFGVRDRVDIRVEKHIPVTAGLGGGSSDAAAVLRCLARAYRVRDAAALAQVALSVGSDVPFFLGAGAAWAGGRGERLRPARVPALDLVLAYPPEPTLAIRAGEAYGWLDADRGRSATSRKHAVRTGFSGKRPDVRHQARHLAARLANDLQAPCMARRPALEDLRRAVVGAGALSAIMSGSGPTVFGVFASRRAARLGSSVLRGAGGSGVEVHVARTLQRLPGVTPWRSPRSASSRSRRRSSRPT
jgi:4-diphosphocytidyl-2-C-methyl-D-erythritol kinase